ncbi:hypothetical protein [Luteococcus sp. H101]|uniref:hypothetical protein n=1 Tax=Luteococcus sp. H101 TaxID=3139402 RepID=UPI00313CE3CC
MSPAGPLLCSAAGAALAGLAMGLVVPRLPEPPPTPPDGWAKPRYATLGTARHVALVSAAGGVAGAVVGLQPSVQWPLLLALAGPGAALVGVDALTTYLPLGLTRWCWVLAGVGLAVAGPGVVPRAALAGLATAALFWLVWRLGAGLGFGDVRLAPLVALSGAVDSWTACYLALLFGSLLGVSWGLVTTLWRRHHPHPLGNVFPYGPSLWLGLWPALLLA